MKDYREKEIEGCIFDISRSIMPKKCKITVRMTNDAVGQSLSLSAFNIMLEIPLEQVKEIIQVTERK